MDKEDLTYRHQKSLRNKTKAKKKINTNILIKDYFSEIKKYLKLHIETLYVLTQNEQFSGKF